MKTFEELETEYAQTNVTIPSEQESGVLVLDGAETLLTLSTNTPFHRETNHYGWFDLQLSHGNHSIWLHNALWLEERDRGGKAQSYDQKIYPNLIVFNAEALGRKFEVRSIVFRMEKLRYFFHHQIVESQSLYEAPKNILKSIRSLRSEGEFSRKYPRTYEFYKPQQIFLVHRPSQILSFKVHDLRYEIGWGIHQRGLGTDSINLTAEPIARILFSRSVPLDQALETMRCWGRFFSQLALERLEITAISAGNRRRNYPNCAEIYLPHFKRKNKAKNSAYAFRRGDTPYASWAERKQLAAVMQNWLSKNEARATFRERVDRVVANMGRETNLEDIVTLCSAIESLDELKPTGTISNDDLAVLSNAAIQASSTLDLAIDANRIKGVLDLLKHQSLPQKLRAMTDAIGPHITSRQARSITSSTLNLRKIAAHGSSLADFSLPALSPTVTALASMCVLYDLLTCSVPIQATDYHKLRAFSQAKYAIERIESLSR